MKIYPFAFGKDFFFINNNFDDFFLIQVYNLKPEQQLQFFNTLKDHLENRNILDLN